MIEVRLDVISDYVYVCVVYTQTWTYDEALKAPKIRTSLDEPIINKIISTAKTGRGTCTECGAKIEKGEHRVGVPYVWEAELQANGKPKRKGPATGAILKYMHLACAQLNDYEFTRDERVDEIFTPPSWSERSQAKRRNADFLRCFLFVTETIAMVFCTHRCNLNY